MLHQVRRRRRRPAATHLTIVCAWCKQRQCDANGWGPRRPAPEESQLSHGICPECYASELAKLGRK